MTGVVICLCVKEEQNHVKYVDMALRYML